MGFLLSNVLRLEKDAHFFFIFIEYQNIPHANFNSNSVNNSPSVHDRYPCSCSGIS